MPVDPNPNMTEEEWLECIPLPAYLAKIPLGHFITITGEEFWKDGNGTEFTTDEYINYHNVDPRVAWKAKKEYLKQHGGGVTVGEKYH